MTERSDFERSTEDIRKDLAAEVEILSRTIAHSGTRISEKPDWRKYAKYAPYVAVGAAAGLGFFTTEIFRNRNNIPRTRLTESIPEKVRDSLGGMLVGTIKMTLLGIATKAAARWLKNNCRGFGRTITKG
jgi:hypothetical protein